MQYSSYMTHTKSEHKTTRVTVSFDDITHQRLRRQAAKDDVSISWLIRRAVYAMLKQTKPVNYTGKHSQ